MADVDASLTCCQPALVLGGHVTLQELLEYLHPETGVVDLAAEGSVLGGGSGGGGDDLEAGLGKAVAPPDVRGGQVIHVDASESLSAVTGELEECDGACTCADQRICC